MFSNLFKLNRAVLVASGSGIAIGSMVTFYQQFYRYEGAIKLEDWVEQWKQYEMQDKSPPWDQGRPNRATKYLNEMYSFNDMPSIRARSQIRILRCFVPLCGDSRDLKLINRHFKDIIKLQPKEKKSNYKIKIIGVEVAMPAIDKFFQRECDGNYSIDYDLFTKIPIYNENNYNIIHCDLFNAAMSRLVLAADCIYDHGSLSAIDPNYRNDYIKFCKNILSKKGKILLTTYDYSKINENSGNGDNGSGNGSGGDKDSGNDTKTTTHNGISAPPYSMNKEDIYRLYEEILNGKDEKDKMSNLILLETSKMSESDDEWVRQDLNDEQLSKGTIDVWLIRGNEYKTPKNSRAIR